MDKSHEHHHESAHEATRHAQRIIIYGAIGNQLSGSLSWLRSFHFSLNGIKYRIAYTINEGASSITIHYAGSRPGFYERLKRHIQ